MLKYATIFILLISFSHGLVAQDQSVPIDRIDRFGNTWTYGLNLKVLDSLIVGIGDSKRANLAQGLTIAAYNYDGTIHKVKSLYDTINLQNFPANNRHDLIDMGSNRILGCYRLGPEVCFEYDVESQEFISIDTIRDKYSHRLFGVSAIKEYNEDIYIHVNVGTNDERRLGVLKYGLDTTLTVFGETISSATNAKDLMVTGIDEWYAITYNSSDNEDYLYRQKDGEIQNLGRIPINDPYDFGVGDAIYIDGKGIFLATIGLFNQDTELYWGVAHLDTLGNVIWEKRLEEELNVDETTLVGRSWSFIKGVYPSVEGDGVVFVGSEFILEDTTDYANGIIGKVDYDGNLRWLRRYRHVEESHYRNQIYDIDHDSYGGYITFGTIGYPYLDPWSASAWLMRLDKDGLPIDSTVSTVEVETLVESLNIYPNPAVGHIILNTKEKLKSVDIISSLGRNMGSYLVSNGRVDISSLPMGSYLVTGSIKGKRYFGKFIKG